MVHRGEVTGEGGSAAPQNRMELLKRVLGGSRGGRKGVGVGEREREGKVSKGVGVRIEGEDRG